MSIALEHDSTAPRTLAVPAITTGLVGMAGLTSLGAGAIHAAAIGVHSEHRSAVIAFTAVAALQLGWGALAMVRGTRVVLLVGALISAGALAGWAVAKTTGISAIAGLDEAEAIQTADALAAGLALSAAFLLALAALRGGGTSRNLRIPLQMLAVTVSAVTVFGMVSAGSHAHAAGADGHGAEVAAAGAPDGGGSPVAAAHDDGQEDAHEEGGAAPEGEHAVVEPVPYDPTKPIDLSGTEGVTPEQQAAAENLIAVTLDGLPQWSDPEVALASGFRSIGDGGTGTEHFINQANMDDDTILDPDVPESLVWDTTSGERVLAAAMFMTERGQPLSDVPDIGGKLMQWHTHENLCYNAEGQVRGITDAAGNCSAGLTKPIPTPMIHVWIRPHPCGPFAALEGLGAGKIADGETRLCDSDHGA